MRRIFLLAILLTFTTIGQASWQLPNPVVDGGWLKTNIQNDTLQVLDIQEAQLFERHHLPNAVNWPFSEWRTGKNGAPPKSMPKAEELAKRLGGLGIDNETPLLIVSTGRGPGDLSAMARVYWTLTVLGHENMAILDGGLASYVNQFGGDYISGAATPKAAKNYQVRSTQQALASAPQIVKAIDAKKQPLLDARSLEEYVGLVAGEDERAGTLPQAHHLPHNWTMSDTGRLRSKAELQKLFDYAGLAEGGAIHFCHTGNRASLTWFVDYAMLGNKEARLYDGSTLEWAKDKQLPMQQKLGF